MNGTMNIIDKQLQLNVQTENAAIARRIYSLIKETFDVHAELSVRRKMKLKKNNIYICRVRSNAKYILNELGILDGMLHLGSISSEYTENKQKMKSYLRVLFWQGDL